MNQSQTDCSGSLRHRVNDELKLSLQSVGWQSESMDVALCCAVLCWCGNNGRQATAAAAGLSVAVSTSRSAILPSTVPKQAWPITRWSSARLCLITTARLIASALIVNIATRQHPRNRQSHTYSLHVCTIYIHIAEIGLNARMLDLKQHARSD